MSQSLQEYCKDFRVNTLDKTLEDIHLITDVNIKTLSAFEHGRSNNINHLQHYIDACDSEIQLHMFQIGLMKELTNRMNERYK